MRGASISTLHCRSATLDLPASTGDTPSHFIGTLAFDLVRWTADGRVAQSPNSECPAVESLVLANGDHGRPRRVRRGPPGGREPPLGSIDQYGPIP
jgi:hypothetical protein